ncbi:epimerase [Bacillus toyonensis]|uniref:Epimerase n=1 Tax=Bacillus toyonensis TaxID=155322 RepID=A0AB36SU82_9BACI|nr:epimerase [Bacillus toyonensis]PEA33256.1 epimerase [Bacillus toyonensis]PEJ83369.1 epimerase [Bacillus toyonensis]PEK07532.1 epimerase [Bacillus toyonensis]PEN58183.1 epimerase [Bacillus toyonensis]PGC83860.1 epimerase [Bacillus toyonensis]
MNNHNNNETNNSNRLLAIFLIVSPLLIPIALPTAIIVGMKQWMPDEVEYPSIISLLTLCIGFFIVGIIFSFILHVFKLSEEKLKELGFLGFTISIVSTFLTMYVGYFWLANLNFTAVQLSPHAVLIFAILSTILLEAIFKLIDKFDTPNTKETI